MSSIDQDADSGIREVGDLAALTRALGRLAVNKDSNPRREIVIAANEYDLGNATFPIYRRGVTIRAAAGASVVLKNVQLQIDLDSADDVLIQDIAFRSDGAFTQDGKPANPRDAIVIGSLGATRTSPDPRTSVRVRITHCAFNGYFDIAIDSSSSRSQPRIAATIDHCLFFDDNPGQPLSPIVQGKFPFANRGAINISGRPGGALFTIANNVFINVWRRCPRVADRNRTFVYNNLLFRWGIGNDDPGEANGVNEWFAIATDDGGKAAIYGNRFIPYSEKTAARKTISIGPDTVADLGEPELPGISDNTNEFDGAGGGAPASDYMPPTSSDHLDLSGWYQDAGLGAPPTALLKGNVQWTQLVLDAGPASFSRADVKSDLLGVLANPR